MTLAMKQRTICLLVVLIVYCVNKSDGSTGGSWSKTFSSSSASSSASAYSSSSSYSSGPIHLKQIQLPEATAFASANAHLGPGGASANAGASATASAGATANAESVAHSDSSSKTGSSSFSKPGLSFNAVNSGSLINSDKFTSGTANINNKQEGGQESAGQTAPDGAILTNVIAGAYAPSHNKGNVVKNNEGTKNGYYSHDFVLPSRDTESDYDSSEEIGTQKSSSVGSTASSSTTAGSYGSTKSSSVKGITPLHNEITPPGFGQDLSGSITTNTHLKNLISPTTKFPFPGPTGSINDYKPAPPGGGGPDKAWLVTPITPGAHSTAQASSAASSHASSSGITHKLISAFPGAPGSIYDSKPASSVPVNPSYNTGVGCSGGLCSLPVAHKPSYGSVSGCTSGSSCSTYPSSTIGSGLNAVIGILPGPSGSIYDSKPAVGCTTPGCTGQSSSGSYKPSPPISHIGGCTTPECTGQSATGSYNPSSPVSNVSPNYPTLPGSSGSIHDSKPLVTCNYPGCIGQVPSGSYKPSTTVSNVGSGYPVFPGGAGSIHESKPVTGCSSAGCSGQHPSGSYKPSTTVSNNPPLPGSTGNLDDNKPVVTCNYPGCTGYVPSEPNKPSIPITNEGSGYPTIPGGAGSIHESKPVAGCTSPGCSGQYPSSSNKPVITNTGYPSLPGSSGSIHDSKPVVTCNYPGCTGNVPNGSYKPISSIGSGYPTSSDGTGNVLGSKPVAGCTSPGCSGQYPTDSYKPGTIIPGYPSFPGSSGSIHESKPASGVIGSAVTGSIAESNIGTFEGTNQHIPLPGPTGSIHQSKPAFPVGSTTGNTISSGQTQVNSNINPELPSIINSLPGQPGSIYNSKATTTASAQANAYANANTGASANIPCAGSSCAYPSVSGNKAYDGTKCSGSACNSHLPSTPGSFIPVKVISDGYHANKPSVGFGGCSGSSCGGYNAGKPGISTDLVPPSVGTSPPQSISNLPSSSQTIYGCTGTSCTSSSPSASQSGCAGPSCYGGQIASGQTASAQSDSASQVSVGSEKGLFTSKPTTTSTSNQNGGKACTPSSPGCSTSSEQDKISNDGVISGPGTGSIPVDETSSGSYLGLKIPGDSGDVKPVMEISDETEKASHSSSGGITNINQAGAYSGVKGTNSVSVTSSNADTNSYQLGSTEFVQPNGGCSGQFCGSSSAGSGSNKANGLATGSVYVQGADGVQIPGPDNSKTYGTEKPGEACTSGTCGSYGSSGTYSAGCSSGNCGSQQAGKGGASSPASGTSYSSGGFGGSGYNGAEGTTGTGFGGYQGTSGSYSGGCRTGNCGSQSGGSAGASAFASSTGCSGGSCGGSGYNRADGTAGAHFGGIKGTSGAYSSASSVAGSGIDLGPLAHFFGTKGGATAKAGSYSSSGSLANSGSFASSFSSASSGSY